jgi:hypothetical protein
MLMVHIYFPFHADLINNSTSQYVTSFSLSREQFKGRFAHLSIHVVDWQNIPYGIILTKYEANLKF